LTRSTAPSPIPTPTIVLQRFNEWTPDRKKIYILKTFSIFSSNPAVQSAAYIITYYYYCGAPHRKLVVLNIPTLDKRLWSVPHIYMYSGFALIIVYRPQMINGNRLQLIPNSRQTSIVQHSVHIRLNSDHALLGIVRVLAKEYSAHDMI